MRRLTYNEIERLAEMALTNARELLEEAVLLHEAGRFARATALAIIVLEELGKRTTLWRAVNFGANDTEWKLFWRRFRDHATKVANVILENLIYAEGSEAAAELDKLSRQRGLFTGTREAALYVDIINDKPHQPSLSFTRRLSELVIASGHHHLKLHEQGMPTKEMIAMTKVFGNRKPGETLQEWIARTEMELPEEAMERIRVWDEEERANKKPYPP